MIAKDKILIAYQWYLTSEMTETHHMCQNRAIFQARLNSMHLQLLKKYSKESVALLDATIGEIGINCFDHNLGQWRDVPGCWFEYGFENDKMWSVISDRGQGILSSLKKVVPELKNDQEALETAFQKRISGRSPEQRGNGLKFVRNIMNGNADRGLLYLSGHGKILFGKLADEACQTLEIKQKGEKGTFSLLIWRFHEN